MISPFRLDLPEGSIECEIDLAAGSERLVVLAFKMLPVSSEVAAMARRAAERLGLEVACKERCGACCRQLVPLSPPEAAMVFEFVETMPEPQKSEARKGFDLALGRLRETRFLDKLKRLQDPFINDEEHEAITNEYFHQQVPCPFLVNESCSIYEVRPSMCREYLVNSPAENCKSPGEGGISRLPVCVRLSEALARTWASMSNESQ
jgi:Fe-S-cluster containining protein